MFQNKLCSRPPILLQSFCELLIKIRGSGAGAALFGAGGILYYAIENYDNFVTGAGVAIFVHEFVASTLLVQSDRRYQLTNHRIKVFLFIIK